MPLYTLAYGGLMHERKFYPHGSEVELTLEQAADINLEGPVVKLSAHLKAEAEAEKKKAEHLARLNAEIDAKLKAEAKAEAEAEKKKAAAEKGGGK